MLGNDVHAFALEILIVLNCDLTLHIRGDIVNYREGAMVVREMAAWGVPWPVILACLLLVWTTNVHHHPINYSAFFEGERAQANAFDQSGMKGHAHDLSYGEVPR